MASIRNFLTAGDRWICGPAYYLPGAVALVIGLFWAVL